MSSNREDFDQYHRKNSLYTESVIPKVRKKQRTIRVHVTTFARALAIEARQFCTNEIVTRRYTLYSFIPRTLIRQFRRPANFYFLVISALQARKELSTTRWETTILPLLFVFLLNAFKEAYDEFRRKVSDEKVNKRQVEILKNDKFVSNNWSTVVVGDILKINADEEFPADLVFLSSSDPQGLAYIETANLDGESSLKIRHSFYKLSKLIFEGGNLSLSIFAGMVIKCEKPNNRMFQFEGSISLQGEGRLEIDETQILLRGATLRHTEWILGAVVFTGMDTKLMRNMISGSHKVSSLEKNSNFFVGVMMIILFILCLGLAIATDILIVEQTNKWPYYLPLQSHWPEPKASLSLILIQMLRFVLLMNEFIPISMYVTLEIVKVVQCLYVNWDIEMFHHDTNEPSRARASGLTEELGQVEYILSDKTGTLTQNLMAFIKCSIGGEVYGKSSAESSNATTTTSEDTSRSVHNVAHDPVLIDILNTSSNPKSQICRAFFTHIALCHTVIPNYVYDDEIEEICYQSTSPDETALVQCLDINHFQGASECGFHLKKRTPEELVVFIEGQGLEQYIILAMLEFTPERKRMSIICQEHKGRIKLYCKGADTIIFKRLAKSQDALAEISQQHLEEFAKCGFRTLCMAERELSQEEFRSWAVHFHQASLALDDRDQKLAAVAENIERDMVLLGVSAVEDKLQEGVPETVTQLGAAGIKLWVLTGDKLETAVSIGLSCNLLAESMHLFLLSESIASTVPMELRSMVEEARILYKTSLVDGAESSSMATVIEGASVGIALEESNRLIFLELCKYCRAVVCCRVSPLQKAQVTKLVKEEGKAVTLAIGDGANDVGMIKAAQIGVGICGREGRAAEMASDYAIGQFRFLERLLFIHGRWSYKRNRNLVMYSIYKNIVFSLTHFFFSFISQFSAQTIYIDVFVITYNYLWTLWPTLWCAILDIDVSARTSENNPQLYAETQLNKGPCFIKHMVGWIIIGVWHSIIAFSFPCMALLSISNSGETGGMWTLGSSIYVTTLLIVTVKLAIQIPRYTLYHIISICFPPLILVGALYFTSISFESNIDWIYTKAEGIYLFSSPNLWLFIALGPIAACLPDTTIHVFSKRKSPQDFQIMQEIEHGWQDNVYTRHHQNFVDQLSEFTTDQVLEEDGINQPNKGNLSNDSMIIETSEEGGSIEINVNTSLKSKPFLNKQDTNENTNRKESSSLQDMLTTKNENISKGEYISSPNRSSRVKFNFTEALRKSFNKSFNRGKDKKPIVAKESAKPIEIIEALGINGPGVYHGDKSTSPWKILAKQWSLTTAPQREAPVQIKTRTHLPPKIGTRKVKKKTLKANPAMSRLTRLASTRFNISDSDLYAEDEDYLIQSSEHVMPNIPQSPYDQPLDNSINYLGYSTSKPQTSNFITPSQISQNTLEGNLHPPQSSTINHYSNSKSGPNYQNKNSLVNQRQKQSRGSSFYGDDYDIEIDTNDNIPKSQNQKQEVDHDKREVNESPHNLDRYGNKELETYNDIIKKDIKENPKPPKYPSQKFQDIKPSENKDILDTNDPHEQMDPTMEKTQPLYRRVSASGHVSLILQPDSLDLPPHESPFADYTKHGLNKTTPKSSIVGDTIQSIENNDKNTYVHDLGNTVFLQSELSSRLDNFVNAPDTERIDLQPNLSKRNISNVVDIPIHELSFADYSKHELKEKSSYTDNSSYLLPNIASNVIPNIEVVQGLPLPTIPIILDSRRSPLASETGDPSHSITYLDNSYPLMQSTSFTPQLTVEQPSVDAQTLDIGESSITKDNSQRISRVSLYSNVDVPTYEPILEVVPHRSSKSE